MGGTIDKKYPQRQGAYAFEIDEPAVKDILIRMKVPFAVKVTSICKKDSQDLRMEDRTNLFAHISQSACSKFIVTHGTDTMIETGQFLSTIKHKTIIITGSFLPASCVNSDASAQIGSAILASQTIEKGTYICMNGLVIPIDRVVRNSKTGIFEHG